MKTSNKPPRLQQGPAPPSFCWNCGRQLMRVKGTNLFYFKIEVEDGVEHKVHGKCSSQFDEEE